MGSSYDTMQFRICSFTYGGTQHGEVCLHCAGAFGGQRSISDVGSPPSCFLRQHLSPPWAGLVITSHIPGWESNSCTSIYTASLYPQSCLPLPRVYSFSSCFLPSFWLEQMQTEGPQSSWLYKGNNKGKWKKCKKKITTVVVLWLLTEIWVQFMSDELCEGAVLGANSPKHALNPQNPLSEMPFLGLGCGLAAEVLSSSPRLEKQLKK